MLLKQVAKMVVLQVKRLCGLFLVVGVGAQRLFQQLDLEIGDL